MKISPGWTSRPTQTSLGRKLLLKMENKVSGGNVDDNQLMRSKYKYKYKVSGGKDDDNQLMRRKYWKTLLVQKLIDFIFLVG